MTNTLSPNTTISTALCPYAKDILGSKDFHPYQMADQYEALQQRTGFDFSANIKILNILPVFIDGPVHKDIRKQMALRLQATRAEQEAAVVTEIKRLLDFWFQHNNEIELMRDFVRPLWRALSHSIIQRDEAILDVVDDIPLLFFASLSLNKRKYINEGIATAIEQYGDAVVMDLALASLGVKPFVGSLTMTLYDVITQNQGNRLCDIDLGGYFTNSSLRFVDRIAKRDVDILDRHYYEGERVRCVTQSPQYSDEENAASLYGAGNHLCLGKSIAQFTLEFLAQELKNYRCRITAIEFQPSADQEPFAMPRSARIAIRV